jgi:hypothetical protein
MVTSNQCLLQAPQLNKYWLYSQFCLPLFF